MKALMILGAITGFLIGIASGLAGHSSWPVSLWRASAAALIAAVLTRWWSGVWFQGLRDSLERNQGPQAASNGSSKPNHKT